MTLRTKRYRNSAALLIFMRSITIFNFSFEQSFRTQSRGIPSRGLTPNPEPRTTNPFPIFLMTNFP